MRFGKVDAVKNASFELAKGKFLTILGPSGSGKTTLLRLIAGFGKPTSGEIFINGKPVSEVPSHKRAIGMVFQRLALFPHMTAEENVAFPLKMRRRDARSIANKVGQYLDLVKLGDLGARRIHELSGGQQQRVAIARALVFEPDLLLLDEPLAALDVKLREEMQLEFRRIQKELGVTAINVTHDQREALVVSDEIIVMNEGEIQQRAQPAQAYRSPQNAFVANFIGVTNLLHGDVTSVNGKAVIFQLGDATLEGTMGGSRLTLALGETCTGILRAEQIRITVEKSALGSLGHAAEGVVSDAIFEGQRIVYEVKVPSLSDTLLRVFDHDPAAHTQFQPGQRVHLGWNPQDILVFRKQEHLS